MLITWKGKFTDNSKIGRIIRSEFDVKKKKKTQRDLDRIQS